MKSVLNAKKKKDTSNLIKVTSDYNISTGNKSQQVQKTTCHSIPKTFVFSQNSFVPFHQLFLPFSLMCTIKR